MQEGHPCTLDPLGRWRLHLQAIGGSRCQVWWEAPFEGRYSEDMGMPAKPPLQSCNYRCWSWAVVPLQSPSLEPKE